MWSDRPRRLFHVSDIAGIERFAPRPGGAGDPAVWAIEERLLPNYLLPRDCPRVTFYATPESEPRDVVRFLAGATHVVAVEESWVDRIATARLYLYEMPQAPFRLTDAIAGYYTANEVVEPLSVVSLESPVFAIGSRGSALRVLPGLWELHDQIAASSLAFSMIRMRNASPRQES
ncbi:MAG TPA: hypothetical protein VFK32_00155 [Tepidiformaceae bacterium]|nr:hypothetical protein [Tepidiformaceae bacterium]